MDRQDKGLAWMLQFENIAWYEDGMVRILDRRIYPIEVKFCECKEYREVVKAIADMVTQSAGPYVAAAMGMALAAYECRGQSSGAQLRYLTEAAVAIANARPTTAKRMKSITVSCLEVAKKELESGNQNIAEAIRAHAVDMNNIRYSKIGMAAKHLANKFPTKGSIMTQCFAETMVGQMLKEARNQGKDIKLFCPETRPYFQGSRLTATVAYDMGFDVTVITDNMPATVMKNEGIDIFTSAADVICGDGHVINKVGTYQIALVANSHNVPYYVTGAPDKGHPSVDTVKIEMREPTFVLQAMGIPTSNQNVKGYYPAFDITPPELVKGVVTDKEILNPFELHKYIAEPESFLV